jgi:inward rectifier potassium channel
MRTDGTPDVQRIGLRRDIVRDLYHTLLVISWPGLLGLLAGLYFTVNAVFAALYLLGWDAIVNARPGSFVDAFEFSVQTFATIGYGVFAPRTGWAHAVVSVEALAGIVYSAFATGLMFSKFARPSARVLFAEQPVVTMHEGTPTLIIRIANSRFNQLFEASAKLRLSRLTVSREGQRMRKFFDLPLLREQTPMLALSWTLFHRIDDESPLFGLTPEDLERHQAMLILMISGTDETVVQTVHARKVWRTRQIAWDHRYVDIMEDRPGGGLSIHYERFSDVVPVDPAHSVLPRLFPPERQV